MSGCCQKVLRFLSWNSFISGVATVSNTDDFKERASLEILHLLLHLYEDTLPARCGM